MLPYRAEPGCRLCTMTLGLAEAGDLEPVGGGWTVNSYQGLGERPRLVVQPGRHVSRWSALSVEEQGALGRAVAGCARALEGEPGVARVYAVSYNETAGHLHVHLVPRFEGEDLRGPQVEDPGAVEVPAGFDLRRAIRRARSSGIEPIASSPVVRRTRAVLQAWNGRFSAYRLARVAARRRLVQDAGEAYVGTWFAVLLALVLAELIPALFGAAPAVALVVAGAVLAAYRTVDMAVFVLTILTTTFQSDLQSAARTLLLFFGNLLELTAAAFLLLVAAGAAPLAALPQAVDVTTSLGGADPALPAAQFAVVVAVSVVTLTVVTLGVAMIVGRIGDTFRDLSARGGEH